jgi:putative Holliday junction resolvase
MIFKTIAEFYPHISQLKAKGMGVDYGKKKTGVAITNVTLTMALPVCIINTASAELLISKIASLIKQYEVGFLVLGFPGEEYDARPYEKFAQLLSNNFALPIYLQDETLSSRIASQMLRESGIKRRKHDKMDDHISAQVILESFLDKLSMFLKGV